MYMLLVHLSRILVQHYVVTSRTFLQLMLYYPKSVKNQICTTSCYKGWKPDSKGCILIFQFAKITCTHSMNPLNSQPCSSSYLLLTSSFTNANSFTNNSLTPTRCAPSCVSGVNKVVFNHDASSSSMLFDLIIESIARRIDQTSLCIKTFHCGFWSSSTKKKHLLGLGRKNKCLLLFCHDVSKVSK